MAVTYTNKAQAEKGDEPLLTLAVVRELKADYEADVRLLAELPARVEAKKRRLEAAMMFLPAGVDLDAGANVETVSISETVAPAEEVVKDEDASSDTRLTWAGEMARVLASLDRGIAHKELLERLKQTDLGQRSSPGEKGFYNAVARLSERGVLVKAGGLLYHKSVADRLTTGGQALPDMTIEVARRAGGSASLVVETLIRHPKGLTAAELKKLLAAREDAPKSLREHGQYIYNILSTLMGNGTVTRRNGVYRLKKQERSST